MQMINNARTPLSKLEWTVLLLLFVFSFIPVFGGFIRIFELVGGPMIGPQNPRALADPAPIVLHIISNFVFCIGGALQFLPSIRNQQIATHRKIGRAVAVAGCISAATGLWMTCFYEFPSELQGKLLYWVRLILGTMMLGFIAWAVIAIRSRKRFQHGAFMLRAYAIGQGAATQTFLGIVWMVGLGTELVGPLRDGMMVFAWLLNMLAAEFLIDKFIVPRKLLSE